MFRSIFNDTFPGGEGEVVVYPNFPPDPEEWEKAGKPSPLWINGEVSGWELAVLNAAYHRQVNVPVNLTEVERLLTEVARGKGLSQDTIRKLDRAGVLFRPGPPGHTGYYHIRDGHLIRLCVEDVRYGFMWTASLDELVQFLLELPKLLEEQARLRACAQALQDLLDKKITFAEARKVLRQ